VVIAFQGKHHTAVEQTELSTGSSSVLAAASDTCQKSSDLCLSLRTGLLLKTETASSCTRGGLDIQKNFFTESVIKRWNRLPREVIESSALEVFKRYVDMALKDTV